MAELKISRQLGVFMVVLHLFGQFFKIMLFLT